ncbi:putative peptidase S8/S53 domain, peptidase S8, subtilisin, Asp-active [Septoria linicola]|nr:putative peptidase S8/S53 domain, peptidase S8, subtilisin, Asp-active [Septoria linicola]
MRSFITALLAVPAALAAPVVLETRQADNIAGSWIVRVNQNSVLADVVSQVSQAAGVQAKHTYEFGSFKGFSIEGVSDLTTLVASIASIQSIEPNTRVTTNALVTQSNVPSYGLARISHRANGARDYIYDDSAGQGTFSYIIDTGIRTTHQDFGGRAVFGQSFVDGEREGDGNGHGTHVAGTTGSSTYGVAKKTTLIAVKVLGAEGSGSNAGVLAGIDWAVNDAKSKGRIGKAVANLSLGGPFSPMTNAAVAEAVRQGLFLAVAAGNSGLPTITASPASAPEVCTVGASDNTDKRASYSNFGALVDIFAPGSNITSTWKDSDSSINTISGTSMASPHIAGLGAYLLSLEGSRTPDALCKRIQDLSTKNALNLGLQLFSGNRLAYNGNGA